jgi:hypothetical protein
MSWQRYCVSFACETSHCILPRGCSPPRRYAFCTLSLEGQQLYVPSERHAYYTLQQCSPYPEAIYPMPNAVYALLRPCATLYPYTIAIHRMPQTPICVEHWDRVIVTTQSSL